MDRTCRQKYLLANKSRDYSSFKILLVNSGPICCELVKNMLCMGFSNITICTQSGSNQIITKTEELESFILQGKEGENKVDTLAKRMERLRDDVTVQHINEATIANVVESIRKYDIVAICDQYIFDKDVQSINAACRENNIPFIAGDVKGLMISLFSDFGDSYKFVEYSGNPNDIDGVPVYSIEFLQEPDSLLVNTISVLPNSSEGCKIHLKSVSESIEFNLTSAEQQGPYQIYKLKAINAGVLTEVIDPSKGYFLVTPPAEQEIENFGLAKFVDENKLKDIEAKILRLGIQSMDFTFWYLYKKFGNQKVEDFIKYSKEEILEFRKELKEIVDPESLPEQLWYDSYLTLIGKCTPLNTIVAGFLSNLIFAAFTGNYKPIDQWLCYSFSNIVDASLVSEGIEKRVSDFIEGKQHDQQWLLFGDKIMSKVENLNILQVGCGATGCETAKLLSEIGIGKFGKLTLVDVDSFAETNRNRQFLCYKENVGQSKSLIVKKNLQEFYPKHNIQSKNDAISAFPPDNKFFDDFYKEYDCYIGTVDNEKAREYLCKLALFHTKYFLECGTQSLKFQATAFKPPENGKPGFAVYLRSEKQAQNGPLTDLNCTPKIFPYLDSHAIQASVDLFNKWFNVTHPARIDPAQAFNEEFYTNKLNLLQDASGWNELRKKPTPIQYDENCPLHKSFYDHYSQLVKQRLNESETVTFDKDNILHLDFIINVSAIICEIFSISSRNFDYFRVQRIAAHVNPSIITTGAIAAAMCVLNIFTIASHSQGGVSHIWRNHFGDLAHHSFRPGNIRPTSAKIRSGYVLEVQISPESTFNDLKNLIFDNDDIEPFVKDYERESPDSFPFFVSLNGTTFKIQPSRIQNQIKSVFNDEPLANTYKRFIIYSRSSSDYLFVKCSFI